MRSARSSGVISILPPPTGGGGEGTSPKGLGVVPTMVGASPPVIMKIWGEARAATTPPATRVAKAHWAGVISSRRVTHSGWGRAAAFGTTTISVGGGGDPPVGVGKTSAFVPFGGGVHPRKGRWNPISGTQAEGRGR